MKPVLLCEEDLAALRDEYVTSKPHVEAADPRLVALLEEHARLRAVLAAASALVEAVHEGDEGCVCGKEGRHGRGCPVAKLGRAVRGAGVRLPPPRPTTIEDIPVWGSP